MDLHSDRVARDARDSPAAPTDVSDAVDITHVAPVRTRYVAIAAMVGVAGLAGLFLLGFGPRRERLARLEAGAAEFDDRPVTELARPTQAPAGRDLVLPADVKAYAEVTLEPRVDGYVKRLLADLGDRVASGQLLAEIDAPDLDVQSQHAEADLALSQVNVAKAENDLELAKATLARYEGFAQKGGVTPQDLDEKRSLAAQADVALRSARANVLVNQATVDRLTTLRGFEKVVAPFAGTITARDLDVGTLVTANGLSSGRGLFTLARTDLLRVFVDVPQADATSIATDDEAFVSVRNHPGREFKGKVTRTAGALDPATRTLRVQIDVPNPDGLLLPGMYGSARIVITKARGVATVPSTALVFDAQGTHVWTVTDGRTTRRDVVVGTDFGSTMEIESGLEPDSDVVVNPSNRLVEGGAVRVSQRAAAGGR